MSFFASNNRIHVTRHNGQTVFDTERRLPHIIGVHTGRVTLPERWGNGGCASVWLAGGNGATFLFPALTLDYAGRYIHNVYGPNQTSLVSGHSYAGTESLMATIYYEFGDHTNLPNVVLLAGHRALSVALVNGQCLLIDDWVNLGSAPYFPAIDVDYKIYLGTFT